MKKASEWVTKEDVARVADALVADGEATLSSITAYQVAKKIECHPNSSVHEKFREWKQAKKAQQNSGAIEVPAEMAAALQTLLTQQAGTTKELCLDMVRSIAATFEANANLRVAGLIQETAQAQDMSEELLQQLKQTENECERLVDKISSLEVELEKVNRERNEFAGALKALEPLIPSIKKHFPGIDTSAFENAA